MVPAVSGWKNCNAGRMCTAMAEELLTTWCCPEPPLLRLKRHATQNEQEESKHEETRAVGRWLHLEWFPRAPHAYLRRLPGRRRRAWRAAESVSCCCCRRAKTNAPWIHDVAPCSSNLAPAACTRGRSTWPARKLQGMAPSAGAGQHWLNPKS